MAKRGAVVRTLAAIETVGEATVVCADKTGTLTENRLRVESMELANGTSRHDLLAAALAAAAAEIDPVDRALVRAADEAGVRPAGAVVRSIPFEASRRRSTVVVRDGGGRLRAVVKGAPEVVLDRMGDAEASRLATVAERWGQDGLRVLALAAGPAADDAVDDELDRHLRPLGLLALEDPLRPGAAEAVRAAREAGLGVRMLTGDHPGTASAIGRRLGLAEWEIVARCTPAEKLALVEQLEEAGEIVIVTGDGVNDAPALRRAHVGIAMGRGGSEAAREASSIVLTDDDFSTIVAAVQEGRRIAGNVRSFLAFLLSANVGEVVLFAIAVLAGLGAPMTVVQVLTVNLVTDGPPAVALALDPAGARGSARRPGSGFGPGLLSGLLVVGTAVGLAALGAFLLVPEVQSGSGQTAAYVTVALAELVFVFSCRSEREPPWRLPRNIHLELAALASLGVLAATVYAPALQGPFETVALGWGALLVILGLAVVPALVAEGAKAVRHRRLD
jgi:P-type Ca2+ transporter type 2C